MTPERMRSLAALIRETGAPAMVIGGLAVAIRGRPRMTRDADVTLALDSSELPRVLIAAERTGFEPRPSEPRQFVRETGVLPLQRVEDGWEVDIIFGVSPYEAEAVARAGKEELHGVVLPIISAEDLLVHKLLAGRPKDIEDAASVVTRQGENLDKEFVRRIVFELAEALADDDLRRRAVSILGGTGE